MPKKRPPNAETTEFRTGEQQVKIARQGGIASGESRRRKKLLHECLDELLAKEYTTERKTLTGSEALAVTL